MKLSREILEELARGPQLQLPAHSPVSAYTIERAQKEANAIWITKICSLLVGAALHTRGRHEAE